MEVSRGLSSGCPLWFVSPLASPLSHLWAEQRPLVERTLGALGSQQGCETEVHPINALFIEAMLCYSSFVRFLRFWEGLQELSEHFLLAGPGRTRRRGHSSRILNILYCLLLPTRKVRICCPKPCGLSSYVPSHPVHWYVFLCCGLRDLICG